MQKALAVSASIGSSCAGGGGLLGLGATVVTCTATCDVTNRGTVTGEPHFVGFDGSRYDFQGRYCQWRACLAAFWLGSR